MTPEVSAIVRELRERARTLHSALIESFADKIEAGTFVASEAAIIAPEIVIGARWGDLSPGVRATTPVGSRLNFPEGHESRDTDGGWIKKSPGSVWTTLDDDECCYDGDVDPDRIITHIPDNQ